jgi:hypothetical protein
MKTGAYNQPKDSNRNRDNTVFTYLGEYKLHPSLSIIACNNINSYNEQQLFIGKGSIQVDVSFTIGSYAPYHQKWCIPLCLLGFNPLGNYEIDREVGTPKTRIMTNSKDGDDIYYESIHNDIMVMKNEQSPLQQELGIVPYIRAIACHENSASRLYDPTNAAIVDYVKQPLTAEYEQAVLDNFFTTDDKEDSGKGYGLSLVSQIKDVTQNKFSLIEIYEHVNPKMVPYKNNVYHLLQAFPDEDKKMTHIIKETYANTQYKAGESRALLSYISRSGEEAFLFLPLLCLTGR